MPLLLLRSPPRRTPSDGLRPRKEHRGVTPACYYISTTIFPVLPPVNSSRKASGMDSMP